MKKIKVGKIVNTHGIKGELKVAFNDLELFEKGMTIYIETRNEMKEFRLTDFRVHKNHLLIKLDDYNNINDVELYKTLDIFIDADDDEVYYSDLIGYSVLTDKKVGVVKDIINNTAQDIFVLDNGIMIPYVDVFIKEINDEEKIIYINAIEGLINED